MSHRRLTQRAAMGTLSLRTCQLHRARGVPTAHARGRRSARARMGAGIMGYSARAHKGADARAHGRPCART